MLLEPVPPATGAGSQRADQGSVASPAMGGYFAGPRASMAMPTAVSPNGPDTVRPNSLS
jgi:hypothetical protein